MGLGVGSAVQRAFLDGVGHDCAKQGDDGARVVAADHGAARYDHVGSGLREEPRRENESQTKRVIHTRSGSLTSAHLSMVSGPTPPSTSMSSEGN